MTMQFFYRVSVVNQRFADFYLGFHRHILARTKATSGFAGARRGFGILIFSRGEQGRCTSPDRRHRRRRAHAAPGAPRVDDWNRVVWSAHARFIVSNFQLRA
jgi:hypothetical protein